MQLEPGFGNVQETLVHVMQDQVLIVLQRVGIWLHSWGLVAVSRYRHLPVFLLVGAILQPIRLHLVLLEQQFSQELQV